MRRLLGVFAVLIGALAVAMVGAVRVHWNTALADGTQGVPHLAIDADPANGTRPCSPIDASRTGAPTSGTYTVALCLEENQGASDSFDLRVVWSGGVATAPEVADVSPALADNPDFNEAAGPNGNGSNWNCTSFGLAFPQGDDPTTAGQTDAHIVCNENSFAAGALTADPGLLATLTMQASGSGTMSFTWDVSSSVNSPASVNYNCADVTCHGATVTQGTGPAQTATTTNTPAATSTPSCGGESQPVCTTPTIAIGFRTFTPTPSPEATEPAPTATVAGPGTGETPSTGGPGSGAATPPTGVVGPDTGTGGYRDTSSVSLWLWILGAAVMLGVAGLTVGLSMARARR